MKRNRTIITLLASLILVLAMSAPASAASRLTEKEAVAKAFADAGVKKSNVILLETELEKGKYEIEFVNKADKTEYEYEISASNGRILEKSVDYAYKHNASRKKIGAEAARRKAAVAVGVRYSGIKNCKCVYKYDKKKKEGIYEVKFGQGNYRYEIEILAPTGKVIGFEKEYVKK